MRRRLMTAAMLPVIFAVMLAIGTPALATTQKMEACESKCNSKCEQTDNIKVVGVKGMQKDSCNIKVVSFPENIKEITYIIDGQEVSENSEIISNLDPNNIESVTVIKKEPAQIIIKTKNHACNKDCKATEK